MGRIGLGTLRDILNVKALRRVSTLFETDQNLDANFYIVDCFSTVLTINSQSTE